MDKQLFEYTKNGLIASDSPYKAVYKILKNKNLNPTKIPSDSNITEEDYIQKLNEWFMSNLELMKDIEESDLRELSSNINEDYDTIKTWIERRKKFLERRTIKDIKKIDKEEKEELINKKFNEILEKLNKASSNADKYKIYEDAIKYIGSLAFNEEILINGVKKMYCKYNIQKLLREQYPLGVYGIIFSNYNKYKGTFLFDKLSIQVSLTDMVKNNVLKKEYKNGTVFYMLGDEHIYFDDNQIKVFELYNKLAYLENIEHCIIGEKITGYTPNDDDMEKLEKEKNILSRKVLQTNVEPISKNEPKCPTCGSKNIMKISTINRGLSIGLFGLSSSKIGKTMECKNCGYKR